MIDLHLHLDGSLSAETIIKLAGEEGVKLPVSEAKLLKPYICAAKRGGDLNKYLQCFEIPVAVLQSEKSLEYAVKELIKRLDLAKMKYAEIRFAPQLHTKKSLTTEGAAEAAVRGLEDALGRCKSMVGAQIILCCMRNGSMRDNIDTVRAAKNLLGHGVAAVDLAGAEALYSTADFREVFLFAEKLGIPFTIHAGEAAGAESVLAAIEMGARRIGHGVRICESEEAMKIVGDNGMALEMCPTSNVQTGATESLKKYPIREFLKKGIIATVNTDNMTVSDTTLKKEFSALKNSLSLTAEEEKMLLLNAVYASFLPEEEKQKLYEYVYEKAPLV